jgi:hypothetical protein
VHNFYVARACSTTQLSAKVVPSEICDDEYWTDDECLEANRVFFPHSVLSFLTFIDLCCHFRFHIDVQKISATGYAMVLTEVRARATCA